MDIRAWRKLNRHPLSKKYEDISGKAWENYVATLREFGIVDGRKIVVHEKQVIDGWQLYRACLEADVKPEFILLRLPKDMTAEQWVEVKNDLRRHETQDAATARIAERRERVAAARVNGQSLRTIAENEEVSKDTVLRDLAASTVSGETVTPESGKSTGKDGREQPATKPKKPKILCERCQRVGERLDCEACAEVRRAAKKPKTLSEIVDKELSAPEEEKADKTIEDIIKEKNAEIESFCRKLMSLVNNEMPDDDEWLTYMNRRAGALQKFKDGCETLRSAKCSSRCPMCKGDGCPKCQKTGRVTKYVYDQLVS